MADRFYGQPSAALQVVGITGTNGKTSVSQMLAQALNQLGSRCGVIGTLGSGFPDALIDHGMTTPDASPCSASWPACRQRVRVRSPWRCRPTALDQQRVAAVRFAVGVFTNLSRDHLDYHGSMQAYGEAKAELFKRPLSAAVINLDDRFGRELVASCACPIIGFSLQDSSAALYCADVQSDSLGLSARLFIQGKEFNLRSPLLGRFNLSNLSPCSAVCWRLGWMLTLRWRRWRHCCPPAGRMQRLGGGALPLVVVDYAHTPDALEKALVALHEHAAGRVICVFGCGGDRDTGKRPLMARIAEQHAAKVV
ncbi:UDP-N-acetylmuramoyl-L-alanyl-D-glutamate--2,6-diaminopimelate ligase [Halopseudomonas pachastrellae]|nr:UDP-N-acetylmuramoyl-L-alanyl-D-glutamate--2,6-diaminopimelate ligase [Halopseudomonas pachastrellae]